MSLRRRRILEKFCAAAIALPLLGWEGALASQCGTGTHPMTLSATAIEFGIYNGASGSPAYANGTVAADCDRSGDYLPSFTAALSSGTVVGFSPRHLSFGTYRMTYNIYVNSAYGTIWGDGTGATATRSYSVGSALNVTSFTTCGRIPALQSATPGTYGDTIAVTIAY